MGQAKDLMKEAPQARSGPDNLLVNEGIELPAVIHVLWTTEGPLNALCGICLEWQSTPLRSNIMYDWLDLPEGLRAISDKKYDESFYLGECYYSQKPIEKHKSIQ